MNLARGLERRAAEGRPVRVGVIGAGKFGSMFLAQARRTPGLHVVAIADRDVAKVRALLAAAGWPAEQLAAPSPATARDRGSTHLGDDAERVIGAGGIDVLVEATGDPRTGLRHAAAAIDAGRHVVMVTVEADAVAGPLLAERAAAAGVVYSLAYGDQPALICEQVDWARTAGFRVTAAGKGTRYHPSFHRSTPDTVWVVVEAGQEYVAQCIREYGFQADPSGSYLALYRPEHLIGLELGVSIASVALRGEPTGAATGFRADVAAVAKRELAAGEELDGEGGYTVWGKQLPAARSLELGALPLGLAHGVTLRRPLAAGEVLRWDDVKVDETDQAVALRREMERRFANGGSRSALRLP